MLFAVRMDVELPLDLGADLRADTLAREKAYSQEVQRSGKWPHLWRIVGQYSNLSIFDVADNTELHDLLSNLPLFAYMRIEVTPLAPHPSDVDVDIIDEFVEAERGAPPVPASTPTRAAAPGQDLRASP